MRLVEDLVAFLSQPQVQVRLYTGNFLHAKSYLFYHDRTFTRIAPLTAIVGSSNFTRGGLLTNKELNLVHRANLAGSEVDIVRVRGIMEVDERCLLAAVRKRERKIADTSTGLMY